MQLQPRFPFRLAGAKQQQKRQTYLDGPVVGVEHELGEGHDLRGAVPAVRAVHQHWPPFQVHRICHHQRGLQQAGQVQQPLAGLQRRHPTARTAAPLVMVGCTLLRLSEIERVVPTCIQLALVV